MILSGTKYRLRFDDGTGMITFLNATTGSGETTTAFRTITHKDNPGQWDEVLPDGLSGTKSVTFFVENAGRYKQLKQAQANELVITLEKHDGVTGNDKYTQQGYIASVSDTFPVRDNVAATVQFRMTGAETIGTV